MYINNIYVATYTVTLKLRTSLAIAIHTKSTSILPHVATKTIPHVHGILKLPHVILKLPHVILKLPHVILKLPHVIPYR